MNYNKVDFNKPIQQQPTKDSLVAQFLSGIGSVGSGIASGVGSALGGVGQFVEQQKQTPEGRRLLTNIIGGLTQVAGASPYVGAGIAEQSQRSYEQDIQTQEAQDKLLREQVNKENKRQQKLIDDQRERSNKIEDALLLDRLKKQQDPVQARFNARTEASHTILSEFESGKNPYYLNKRKFIKDQNVPYMFKSDQYKQIEQAQRDFINATLRRESGAAIAPSEFENAQLQYFPQPGDTREVVKQKQRNRQMQFAKIEELKQRDPLGIL